jgi:hypothetical protein
MKAVIVREGSFCSSSSVNWTGRSTVGALRSPAPNSFSRQEAGSISGVEVWLRTKKRSFGTRYGRPAKASQRISAFVPSGTNQSGGSGLTTGPAARTVAARATRGSESCAAPSTSGTPSASNRRRDRPCCSARASARAAT